MDEANAKVEAEIQAREALQRESDAKDAKIAEMEAKLNAKGDDRKKDEEEKQPEVDEERDDGKGKGKR